MARRFISLWFRYLITDWFTLRQPRLVNTAFVVSAPSHGRLVVVAANRLAELKGIQSGMVLADARALMHDVQVVDEQPGFAQKLLSRIAAWCIRFTPVAAIDLPDGIVLEVTGCAHLWGGEKLYLEHMVKKIQERGYYVRAAMADTIGTAWAVARFARQGFIVEPGQSVKALMSLPPAALRLEPGIAEYLCKLGLRQIKDFISMPRSALRRRFGPALLERIDQATGTKEELVQPIEPAAPYCERLPCIEPIITRTGIDIALERLLDTLCKRLVQQQEGLRSACFKIYRTDGKTGEVAIATHRPSCHASHLFTLFETKLQNIAPGPGIELFVLTAPVTETHKPLQEKLWEAAGGIHDIRLAELVDRLAGKIGRPAIARFLPREQYWPERSFRPAVSLVEQANTTWTKDRQRPIRLLATPECIDVTAPVPDYPPMNFRYQGKLHIIKKADGPERIEQEWWIANGQHRDYYTVEDESGCRYWLFRSGHYGEGSQWFIHGFFA